MHEFSIASSLLDAVIEQAEKNEAKSVTTVRLRIGGLAGVVMEALEFSWEAVSADTIAAGSRLEVEHVPISCYCSRCAREFESRASSYRCPGCGELSNDLRHGREMDLVSIEVT